MTDYEAFVHELIGYIFKVQDKDDDNLSAEIICRKLYKYGLIESVNHKWTMKYRPRYVWPARIRKTEPQTEVKVEPTWVGVTYGRFEDEPQIDGAIDEARFKAHCMNCQRDVADIKCLDCDGDKYFIPDEPPTDCHRCGHYATDKCKECFGYELFTDSGYVTDCSWR